MRRDAGKADDFHETPGFVALVCSQRLLVRAQKIRLFRTSALRRLAEQPRLTIYAGALNLVGEQQPPEIPLGPFLPLARADPNPLPPMSAGDSSSEPSKRCKQPWEAQACSRVPSTEKCSELRRGCTSGEAISSSWKRAMRYLLSSWSRF